MEKLPRILTVVGDSEVEGDSETKAKSLSPIAEHVVRLWMIGFGDVEIIAREMKVTSNYIRQVLKCAPAKKLMESLRAEIEEEFQNMQRKVNVILQDSFEHDDIGVRLAGASLWLKSNKNKVEVTLSAEDIVANLLNEKKSEESEESEPKKLLETP